MGGSESAQSPVEQLVAMRRAVLSLVVSTMLLLGIVLFVLPSVRLYDGFNKIPNGMSKAEVVQLLGRRPDITGRPVDADHPAAIALQSAGWKGELGELQECVWYNKSKLFHPTFIAVVFDKNNAVVYKWSFPEQDDNSPWVSVLPW